MRRAGQAIPDDYSLRVKNLRRRLGMSQTEMAEYIGVVFATVNRWENGQSRPSRLAWEKVAGLEADVRTPDRRGDQHAPTRAPVLDFAGRPEAVAAIAEAHRLSFGHLSNEAFASEISSIDPLPHQRIAVYEHMLQQSPLRFLLADDAGAGKTIMTGLYVREMLARRLLTRVLVVPPAGLVGNWEREMRTLFRLPFRIVHGVDAREEEENPFAGPESDRVIVSLDTLCGERMFTRLREAVASGGAHPYDLVVFDEAHKLAADLGKRDSVRKTARYLLAEALAGLPVRDERWRLGWSASNILLLTATPHMGKRFPYYCLWRLLLPSAMQTFRAFKSSPEELRGRHIIRRTKEEMVHFDGTAIYPQRRCDTLSYALSYGEAGLYAATTKYIAVTYNKARIMDRSAARLVMTVFQRRLASSTYALMRSFQRRLGRLGDAIELVQAGRGDELGRTQERLAKTADFFESRTADEEASGDGDQEGHETFEEDALGVLVATTLSDLRQEREEVEWLLAQAQSLVDAGEDSKFQKLRTVMSDPAFADEKLIVFTEHRDTAEFLVHRLQGLGFTDQVALIHGGLGYRQREAQVEMFRRPRSQQGAQYLVATDAAGEGINLQFCWVMVNYDVPWNPARLEQRMGRIHRYGQTHDPVVIVNLIAGETREGRVLKVLLEKLDVIRAELSSDKVFDVVGRLFENVPLNEYLEMAATEAGARKAIEALEARLTPDRVTAIGSRERDLYGHGEVRDRLPEINEAMDREQYRRLLPGYIRSFIETATPLLDLRLAGDPDGIFELAPERPGAADELRTTMEAYPDGARGHLTVHRPRDVDAIWMHPGEPVFESFRAALLARCDADGLRGAIFVDPYAKTPYLFHMAQISVVRRDGERSELLETRLVARRQDVDGSVSSCPLEHLLLLHGEPDIAPGGISLARQARELTETADKSLTDEALRMAAEHRARIEDSLPERREWLTRGYAFRTAELMRRRQQLNKDARRGNADARADLNEVKDEQSGLDAEKQHDLALLEAQATLIEPGEMKIIARALIVPTNDPEERKRHDADVEEIAMRVATLYEQDAGATVRDVSTPPLSRAEGLGENPGFDIRSLRPAGPHGPAEARAIEVKGRADSGAVEVTHNEWAAACTLGRSYWLYVVFDCVSPSPRLLRIPDPFRNLIANAKGSFVIQSSSIVTAARAGEE